MRSTTYLGIHLIKYLINLLLFQKNIHLKQCIGKKPDFRIRPCEIQCIQYEMFQILVDF